MHRLLTSRFRQHRHELVAAVAHQQPVEQFVNVTMIAGTHDHDDVVPRSFAVITKVPGGQPRSPPWASRICRSQAGYQSA
jgi:hypothetical protein